ncbi:MAG TPA: ABC transporter substrate-binding protein [Acidimicrobiales bacterium]
MTIKSPLRRSSRGAACLVAIGALLLTSCGARLSSRQLAEALGANGGTGLNAGGQGSSGTGGVGGGTGIASAAGPLAGGTGGTGAGGAGGGGGAAGGGLAQTLPPGGNGGATDLGVTPNAITVGNISTLTGPVPGLFAGAVNGTDAYFAYQNSRGGVFGRQIKVAASDDQFDCGQNKALTQSDIPKVFAFVGSFSLFDNCGAQVIGQTPALSDVHVALSKDAQAEANNFSPSPLRNGAATGPFQYVKGLHPDAIGAAGALVGDVQSAKDAWVGEKATMGSLGYHFSYERIYEPTETDFTADIVQMKSKNVKAVVLIAADVKGIARIQQAAQQQNWHPEVWLLGASAYDSTYTPLAGSAGDGSLIYLPTAMYLGEDSGGIPEVGQFQTWMHRTHPSANADLFAAYGWSSAELFVQALQAAGPRATRASLQAALKNVHQFNDNGFLAPTDPGGKGPPTCYLMVKVSGGGHFSRVDDPPNGYRCDGSYFTAG